MNRTQMAHQLGECNRDFTGIICHEQSLVNLNLENAKFDRASLRRCSFNGNNMSFSSFRNADLKGADLRDCVLHFVDLRDADLSHAYLSGALILGPYMIDLGSGWFVQRNHKGYGIVRPNQDTVIVTEPHLITAKEFDNVTSQDQMRMLFGHRMAEINGWWE